MKSRIGYFPAGLTAMLGLAMGPALVAANTGAGAEVRTVAVQTTNVHTEQAQPAKQLPAAERRRQADAAMRRLRGVSRAIKNRAPGERAHRRWRKRRAAGRA
ncbi:hypothetical protein [Pelagibacterium halotolerans]|uniref:Uncharacterized protein n=1 Tax=Pelagibacterium halotolerans (strain DSM 22347 / JCM 15775 / CGMCC 1.7692 / B2) TaxID=1082931 RepID=G4RDD0_PELHB|nr:hypothetical protein [Pelagibacterium halotolerans]AEQ50756.1 hypothetical protein KKY_717 [Pelagibacterium halotolerans B2]QJR19324.1 hypothetical protein HKM20_13275 [Pelagibacterium halotolerans]SDZ94978.1 hypothetical protein SAMN05428936_101643 [Pelagibacterium halotolerans]